MQNKDWHIKLIIDYLTNKMSDRERYAFEREMESDPFLMDAVEGYQNMLPAQIENELLLLLARLSPQKKGRMVPVWLRVAAAVLVLVGISSLWLVVERNHTPRAMGYRMPSESTVNKQVDASRAASESNMEKAIDDHQSEESVEVGTPNAQDSHINTNFNYATAQNMINTNKVSAPAEVDEEINFMLDFEEDSEVAIESWEDNITLMIAPASMMRTAALSRDKSFVLYRGRVVNADGFPLADVEVSNALRGEGNPQAHPSTNVLTDKEGNFEIQAQQSGAVLQLSLGGLKDKLVLVKNDSIGLLVLEGPSVSLDELAIGYRAQNKASMKKSNLSKDAIGQVENILSLPEPEGGIKALKERIEFNLRLPGVNAKDKTFLDFELIVSSNGKVIKIYAEPVVLPEFMMKMEGMLNAVKWTSPKLNGINVESSRKVNFGFLGEE